METQNTAGCKRRRPSASITTVRADQQKKQQLGAAAHPLRKYMDDHEGDGAEEVTLDDQSIWGELPEHLLKQGVLSKLHVKDLVRMRTVSRSWNADIASLSLILPRELAPRLHLPWFYCMTYSPHRLPVAFDPGMNTWHSLPLPSLLNAMNTAYDPFSSANRLELQRYKPVCSAGNLVCWEHTPWAPGLHPLNMILSKMSSGVCVEIDTSKHISLLVAAGSSLRCVHSESRSGGDDGKLGNVTLVFVCGGGPVISSAQPLQVVRVECNQVRRPRHYVGLAAPATTTNSIATSSSTPATGATVGQSVGDSLLYKLSTRVVPSLQCVFRDGSPDMSLPDSTPDFYYHAGNLSFLQWQPNVGPPGRGRRQTSPSLPDLLVFQGGAAGTSCCTRIAMPDFSRSHNVKVKASYQILQMDADLLLLVLKRKPTCKVRQVFVYSYGFADQGWCLLSNDLTVSLSASCRPSCRNPRVQCAARAGLLFLSTGDDAYLCHLKSASAGPRRTCSTWRLLPRCPAAWSSASNAIGPPRTGVAEVCCPLDPCSLLF